MFKQPLRKSACALMMLLLCLAFGSGHAAAQSTTDGAIGGLVKDSQGAVVQNASVTVKNEETNSEKTATTDGEGRFRVVQLQPGNYSVSVTATGFGSFTQQKVVVEVGRVNSLDIALGVAGAQETVEVTSEAPVINTQQQDFSSNINQTSINELPINGRRWSNFAILTPGSTPDGSFGLISFRGISGLLNNNTVDGGDNNQAFFSEERGRTRISYSISQSAIREFQVNTSNYSAEYGRSAGGVTNAVTKSGTNAFHGDVFYYQRNNKWGARNPLAFLSTFDPATSTVSVSGIKPKDVRHQFGGTIGGPIVKDKAFFFFSYDQQKRDFPGLGIFSNAATLNLSAAQRTTLTTRGISATQINNTLAFLTSLTGEVPRKGDQTLFLPKFDWNINESNSFSITYNRLRWKSPAGIQTQATNTLGRASFGDDFVDIDWVTLRLQSVISPSLLNEARFQYGRDFEHQNSQAPLAGEPTTAFGGTRSPDVGIQNLINFGTPTFLERRSFPDEKRWQYADNMTLTRGSHTIKFGVDINHVSDVIDNLRFEGGSYFYNNVSDFIVDYTNFTTGGAIRALTGGSNGVCASSTRRAGQCYTSNFNQGFGPTASEFTTNDLNFYVQDDIRATQKLTINLGLRWEYQMLPDALIPNPLIPETSQLPKDKNNFGPRVGFAYDILGDGKTVWRGGYGIYFGRTPNAQVSNALTNTGVAAGQNQVSVAPAAGPIFPNLIASGTASAPAVQYFIPGFQNPEVHQADMIVEHQIAKNTVISGSYLFSQGRHLPTYIDKNICPAGSRLNAAVAGVNCAATAPATATYTFVGGPLAGQTATVPFFAAGVNTTAGQTGRPNRLFAAITQITDTVRSDYHALVLQANRRFTDGLQFQTSYTLASANDIGQTSNAFPATNTPFDPFNPVGESGISNFDVRHKFVVSAVWTPDFFGDQGDSTVGHAIFNGFTLAPIVQVYSGRPLNPGTAGSVPAQGGVSSLAGGINGSAGAARTPGLDRNAFRQPKAWNFDMRVSRRFNLGEARSLEFLAEGFNLFNRTQITNVNSTLYRVGPFAGTPGCTSSSQLCVNTDNFNNPLFGTTTEAGGTLFRERQVQLAVRFQF
ncbi:MAG: TonB-dependent receptor [Rubrivivax sp.]|nr:TonB-dependent receptor [Pyrinomonadaceae bacterium]